MKNQKQKSVFILGDAYFNAQEILVQNTISNLVSKGYHYFYSVQGCNFDRYVSKFVDTIPLCSVNYKDLTSVQDIQECVDNCSLILTCIDPKELKKRDDNNKVFDLQDFPISHIYNNKQKLAVEIINLFQ